MSPEVVPKNKVVRNLLNVGLMLARYLWTEGSQETFDIEGQQTCDYYILLPHWQRSSMKLLLKNYYNIT